MPPNYYLITLNSSKINDSNLSLNSALSFPGGSVVKNPPAHAGEVGSIPGLGRSSGEEGNDKPPQYFCLEIPWTEELGGL